MKNKIIITESQYEALLENLKEQTKDIGWGKKTFHFGKSKFSKNEFSQSGGKYTVTIPENEWDAYIAKNENKIITIFKKNGSKQSVTNWGEIKVSDKRFAVGILEAFIKGDYESIRITKKGEKVTEPEKPVDTGKQYPAESFSLPASVPPNSDFFVNNEWILTDVFKQMVETDIVNVITTNNAQIIKDIPEAKDRINVYLKSLSIDTSCSTLPNGIPKSSPGAGKYSKGITFVQLSTERNNAAKQYVIDRLKQLKVGMDDNTVISQNPNGSNTGNLLGTSGPTWDSSLSKAEKDKLRPDYEQYKYARIKLELVFNTYKPTPEPVPVPVPPKEITNVDYDVRMTKYKGGFKITIPPFRIKFGKNKGWKGTRSLACPYFG